MLVRATLRFVAVTVTALLLSSETSAAERCADRFIGGFVHGARSAYSAFTRCGRIVSIATGTASIAVSYRHAPSSALVAVSQSEADDELAFLLDDTGRVSAVQRGEVAWISPAEAGLGGVILYEPVVVEGMVVVAASDRLTTLHERSGRVVWRQDWSSEIVGQPRAVSGRIVVPSRSGVRVVDPMTGTILSSLCGDNEAYGATAAVGGLFLINRARRRPLSLCGFNEGSLRLLWEVELAGPLGKRGHAVSRIDFFGGAIQVVSCQPAASPFTTSCRPTDTTLAAFRDGVMLWSRSHPDTLAGDMTLVDENTLISSVVGFVNGQSFTWLRSLARSSGATQWERWFGGSRPILVGPAGARVDSSVLLMLGMELFVVHQRSGDTLVRLRLGTPRAQIE
ncbi:MAG: PQQ-binding-like beta-propeller repeat protein [Deltaproteobacteria bacterium]|nr:PQQ-binding-like beta-propeller repeat protein [Deltaproteobacteria bacterium]